MRIFTLSTLLCAALLASTSCQSGTLTDPASALEKIRAQDQYFGTPKVIRSGSRVYTAVGFHGATTSMIVGDDGLIMIDSLYGPTSAANAMKALREASGTRLPVKAIIYTHSHQDHIGGASALLTMNETPEVIAPAGMADASGVDAKLRPMMRHRGALQFGRQLPKEEQTNRGIAPAGTYDADMNQGFMKPTRQIAEPETLTIAGVKLCIEKAAGETDDAMFVWLPDDKILFSGDNFYQAFPNLYAIRGTPYRDVRVWADSVEKMSRLNAEHLVPGHTTPLHGEKRVREALTDYAAAIRAVFDQTVEGMNRLEDPVTIAQGIRLPEELAGKPWLSEVYGTVENASKAIFVGLAGWYDGNPVNLHPLSRAERAERMIPELGGRDAVFGKIDRALSEGDAQWALELIEILKGADLTPDETKRLTTAQIKGCRDLAVRESNPLNRNYYLGWAHRLEKTLK